MNEHLAEEHDTEIDVMRSADRFTREEVPLFWCRAIVRWCNRVEFLP